MQDPNRNIAYEVNATGHEHVSVREPMSEDDLGGPNTSGKLTLKTGVEEEAGYPEGYVQAGYQPPQAGYPQPYRPPPPGYAPPPTYGQPGYASPPQGYANPGYRPPPGYAPVPPGQPQYYPQGQPVVGYNSPGSREAMLENELRKEKKRKHKAQREREEANDCASMLCCLACMACCLAGSN